MDHYQTLGVNKNASPDEIKRAYRRLASQHHPDKGGDTRMFQEIQTAYDTLSDPQKRHLYDSPQPQMHGFPGGFNFNFGNPDVNNIFEQMFGRQQGPRPGQFFRTMVNISLEDAYSGAHQQLKLNTPVGVHNIKINIPKGIADGGQLKFDNVIDNGSLLVEFRVGKHLKYDRRGNDLYANHPISVLDLIVGTSFEFTTISGKTLEVNVQPKTQPYMQLKISGQGMPIINTETYGDQIILLKPYIPDNISNDITESILRYKQK